MSLIDQHFRVMKPVPGGYLYRLPSPWLFGPAEHFIVTEEQKARLLDAVEDRYPVRSGAAIVAAIVASAVLLVGIAIAFGAHPGFGPYGFLIASVIQAALAYLAAIAIIRWMRGRVHHAVPDLAPTERRLRGADLKEARLAAVTPGVRRFVIIASVVALLAFTVPTTVKFATGTGTTRDAVIAVVMVLALGSTILTQYRELRRRGG